MMNNEAGSPGSGAGYRRTQNEGRNKSISDTKARSSLSLDPTAPCENVLIKEGWDFVREACMCGPGFQDVFSIFFPIWGVMM